MIVAFHLFILESRGEKQKATVNLPHNDLLAILRQRFRSSEAEVFSVSNVIQIMET